MQIEIEFDLFKRLTVMRQSENDTISNVIQRLIATVSESPPAVNHGPGGLTLRGIHFPNGTKFRATYKGMTYTAIIEGGRWIDQSGAARSSPSDAARAITNNNVNGWRFWHARRPTDQGYILMDSIPGNHSLAG